MICCLFITTTLDKTPNKVKPTIEQVLTDTNYSKEFVEINEAFPLIKARRIIKSKVSDIIAETVKDFHIVDGVTYTFGFFPIYPLGTDETPKMHVNTLYYQLE